MPQRAFSIGSSGWWPVLQRLRALPFAAGHLLGFARRASMSKRWFPPRWPRRRLPPRAGEARVLQHALPRAFDRRPGDAGLTVHTPLIIIRLLGESMRSQAVSTLLMRSPDRPSMPVAAAHVLLHGLSGVRARSGKGQAVGWGWPAAGVEGVVAVPRRAVWKCGSPWARGSSGWVG